MPALGLPQLSVDPVLFLPLWLGTLRDYSGYGNHATVAGAGLYWNQINGRDGPIGAGTGRLSVANTDRLEAVTDNTWFISGKFSGHAVSQRRFIGKADAGGTQFELRTIGVDTLRLYDGVVNRTIGIGTWEGVNSFAVVAPSGGVDDMYTNGTLLGAFPGASTFTADDADTTILNRHDGFGPTKYPFNLVLWYPGVFTNPASEIATLHDYAVSRITPRHQWPGSGLRYPDRETNLVSDILGDWTPVNSAVLSDIGLEPVDLGVAYNGTPNPYGKQDILTPGVQCYVEGEGQGDGTGGKPVVYCGPTGPADFIGTVSTAWQPFSFLTIADDQFFALQNFGGTGLGKFRKVKLWTNPPGYTPRTGDPLFLDNIQTARVTLVDQASGRLSNTPYQIESGTWALNEDATTGERYIECVVAGIISRRNLFAYGTWGLEIYKPPGAEFSLIYIATMPTDISNPGQDGYDIFVDGAGQWFGRLVTTGATFDGSYTAPGYITDAIHCYHATRSPVGEFTSYGKQRGGSWGLVGPMIFGTNPLTNNMFTTSMHTVFDFEAGVRLYADRTFADVLAPV